MEQLKKAPGSILPEIVSKIEMGQSCVSYHQVIGFFIIAGSNVCFIATGSKVICFFIAGNIDTCTVFIGASSKVFFVIASDSFDIDTGSTIRRFFVTAISICFFDSNIVFISDNVFVIASGNTFYINTSSMVNTGTFINSASLVKN